MEPADNVRRATGTLRVERAQRAAPPRRRARPEFLLARYAPRRVWRSGSRFTLAVFASALSA